MTPDIEAQINAAAAAYGVSPALALAVAKVESAGNPSALSPAGAAGVFQLMPKTAAAYGVSDVYDAGQNIDAGVHMLSDLSHQYGGDLASVLAAYNWGSGNLASGRAMPAETVNYIAKIKALLGVGSSDAGSVDVSAVDAVDAGGLLPADSAGGLPAWLVDVALGLGAIGLVWLLLPRRR